VKFLSKSAMKNFFLHSEVVHGRPEHCAIMATENCEEGKENLVEHIDVHVIIQATISKADLDNNSMREEIEDSKKRILCIGSKFL
jgi:hypothetical protein